MQEKNNPWKRFVKFITFVNLPIKKKFLLFGLGTFFWFMLVGTVAVSVLTFIHYRYSQISNTTLPYLQTIQTISPKLENIGQLAQWANKINRNKSIFFKPLFNSDRYKRVSQRVL